MRRFLAPGMLLALVACVEVPVTDTRPPEPGPKDACGAAAVQDLVGQDRRVLAAMKFAGPVRIIGPDMAVTADHVENRLNIVYNDQDVITQVACY